MKHVVNILKGIVIGIANAIPGVSGGTMMVILRVFDKLMNILGELSIKKIFENFVFLFTIALGMGIGIVGSASLLDFCFAHFYVQTQFFFIGVIAGSLPLIYKEATKDGKFRPVHIIPFAAGLSLMIVINVIKTYVHSGHIITSLTPASAIYLFVCGALAAAAMILPGLSGSLVMLILGAYDTIIEAVSADNLLERFPLLIPTALGIIIGILGCAKVVSKALEKTRLGLYAAIFGLITGSLYSVFPRETVETVIENGTEVTKVTGANFTFDKSGIAAVIVMLIGAAIPLLFMMADKKENKNA